MIALCARMNGTILLESTQLAFITQEHIHMSWMLTIFVNTASDVVLMACRFSTPICHTLQTIPTFNNSITEVVEIALAQVDRSQ